MPPKRQAKNRKVIEIYRERRNVPFLTVQNLALTLYSPSVLGPSGKSKADQKYEDFLSKHTCSRTRRVAAGLQAVGTRAHSPTRRTASSKHPIMDCAQRLSPSSEASAPRKGPA